MSKPLEKEFEYYLEHQDELAKEHKGKFVVIKDNEILGIYDSEIEAIDKTSENHELGTFLVKQCLSGTESHTFTFHSRVAFG